MSDQEWNPDTASQEMAALFERANQIMASSLYDDKTSTDSVDDSSAGSTSTDQSTED